MGEEMSGLLQGSESGEVHDGWGVWRLPHVAPLRFQDNLSPGGGELWTTTWPVANPRGWTIAHVNDKQRNMLHMHDMASVYLKAVRGC